MIIDELLDIGAVVPKANATSKRQALSLVADLAAKKFGLKASTVLEALMERESLGSTGVGPGVGVPHARLTGLDRIRGLFVKLDTPISFDAIDDEPVDLLFVLLAPPESGVDHLRALARVSRQLRRPALREQLRNAQSSDALLALLAHERETTTA
jgi:PTS system nitrogen regulatory IIA component